MTRATPISITAAVLMLLATGCHFPGTRGPVSRSLVRSRQLCQRGVFSIEQQEWEQADNLLSQAVAACASNPDAHRHYAQVLWHKGDWGQAVAHLEEALELTGDDATLHIGLAEMRLAMGQIDASHRSAQDALNLDSRLPGAWMARGRAKRARGKRREALADFHRALALAPEKHSIPLEIAELYREMGLPHRALLALQRLADDYSPGEEPQQVLVLQGAALAALERWDEAADRYAAASSRGAPTPEILFQLAQAECAAGRTTAAGDSARQALLLDPNHRPSHELLGRMGLAQAPSGSRTR